MKPALQDNAELRELFALPPILFSTSTALAIPELPPRQAVSGDEEIDAMLWLRAVVKTGQPTLIEKAMQAASLITTPPAELEKRYAAYLHKASNGHFGAVFASFNFSDLGGLAKRSIEKLARQQEAIARFASIDHLFEKTPAELACEKAMRGVKRSKSWRTYFDSDADQRFPKHPALNPHTLADCLHVQAYCDMLYRLRQAAHENAGDHWPALQAYDDFAFRMMSRIAPRSSAEAEAVLDRMIREEQMDRAETNAILRNLISQPRRTCIESTSSVSGLP